MRAKVSVSFTRGFSRALDLTGVKEWPDLSNHERVDYEALRSDWENVGRSIGKETQKCKRNGVG